jgi:hypothetical protein
VDMDIAEQTRIEGALLLNAAGEVCIIVPRGTALGIFPPSGMTRARIGRMKDGSLVIDFAQTALVIVVDGSRPDLFKTPINLLLCEMNDGDTHPEDAGIIRLSRLI